MTNSNLAVIERRIIGKIVKCALASDYTVSVNDGEEWALKRSRDYRAIMSELAATDETFLRFRNRFNGENVGMVHLVHGNGEDVVSDYSDNETMRRLIG